MVWPVHEKEKWYSAQGFGNKVSENYYHEGVDLNLKTGGDSDLGQELLAVADGEITSVCNHIKIPSFGKHLHLKVETPFGTRWFHYAHCQDILVPEGAKVVEGQLIAHLGKTGTTVAHLHFALKNQPTGVDAVAKTETDLAKWEDPIVFIDKVNTYLESQKERYDVVYKGQTINSYETNPYDIISGLKAEVATANTLLENKTVEANTYRTELEKQTEDNKDLLHQLNEARTERDNAKVDLKEARGFGHDLLGIDICAIEEIRSLSKRLQSLTNEIESLTIENMKLQEKVKRDFDYRKLIGKWFLGRWKNGKGN